MSVRVILRNPIQHDSCSGQQSGCQLVAPAVRCGDTHLCGEPAPRGPRGPGPVWPHPSGLLSLQISSQDLKADSGFMPRIWHFLMQNQKETRRLVGMSKPKLLGSFYSCFNKLGSFGPEPLHVHQQLSRTHRSSVTNSLMTTHTPPICTPVITHCNPCTAALRHTQAP